MKKRYIIPTIELIEAMSEEVMVPNQQSFNPTVGANNYAFGEEEDEDDIEWGDRFDNYGTRLWN